MVNGLEPHSTFLLGTWTRTHSSMSTGYQRAVGRGVPGVVQDGVWTGGYTGPSDYTPDMRAKASNKASNGPKKPYSQYILRYVNNGSIMGLRMTSE